MNRHRLTAVIATGTAALLLLTGCTDAGTVTGKSYHKPYTSCAGRPIVCSKHPECWRLDLSNDQIKQPGGGGGFP